MHIIKSIFNTFTQSLCHCNKFQSHHNSHTGHCYVISFGAGERLDVIITIMKHVQCSVSYPPGKQKVGVVKKNSPTFKTMAPPLIQRSLQRPLLVAGTGLLQDECHSYHPPNGTHTSDARALKANCIKQCF